MTESDYLLYGFTLVSICAGLAFVVPMNKRKRKGPGIRMTPRDYFFLIVGLIIGAGLAFVASFIYHAIKFLISLQ